jgi:hypothetical protein
LVIPPSRSLPPLEFCLGTSPIQAARLRPVLKAFGSATLATSALASSGPHAGNFHQPAADLGRSCARADPPIGLQDLRIHQLQLR